MPNDSPDRDALQGFRFDRRDSLSPTDLEDYRWAMDEIRNLRVVLESSATETFLSDKTRCNRKCERLKPQLPYSAYAREMIAYANDE
jgi:hypothetical protein